MGVRGCLGVIGLVTLMAVAAPGWAGTFKGGVYTSNHGYQMTPPEGWRWVDSGNHAVQAEELPGPLAAASVETYDVLFYDHEIDGEEGESPVYDNIMVLVVPVQFEPSNELASLLAPEVRVLLEDRFERLSYVSGSVGKHGDLTSLDLEWKFVEDEGKYRGRILQFLLPSTSRTVVVTCTFGDERASERRALCLEAVATLVPND